MFDKSNTYTSFNLIEMGLMPENWQTEIINVAQENAYRMDLDGNSSTSREPPNSPKIEVFVVEGDVISKKVNWLHKLYQNEFIRFANQHFMNSYDYAEDVKVGVNINLLKGKGARYEWHVDSNPLTGVLFVTTHEQGKGGELIFKLPDETITVYPEAGVLILFDARNIPHTVSPLKEDSFRVSVPLNFYIKGENQVRPDDLDTYIYKGAKQK